MAQSVVERSVPEVVTQRAKDIQAEEIARDLALMDELETFVLSLPKRMAGTNPTPQQIREMAYEDREASLL